MVIDDKPLDLKTFFVCSGKRYVLSTVKLPYRYDLGQYESMVFPMTQNSKIIYKEIFCRRYQTATDAENAHHHYVDMLSQGIKFWD